MDEDVVNHLAAAQGLDDRHLVVLAQGLIERADDSAVDEVPDVGAHPVLLVDYAEADTGELAL